MASPRKTKKKNTRVFIAIGVAGFLALALFMLFGSMGGKFNVVSGQLNQVMTDNEEMKKKLEEAEQRLELMKKVRTNPAQPQQEVQSDFQNVVVASIPLSAGTVLSKQHLKTAKWPKKSTSIHNFHFENELLGRILTTDVQSDSAIEDKMLIDKDTQTLDIQRGFRAMTIPIDTISGVGGFIMPGSRVDLLTVVPKSTDDKSKSDEKISKVLIQNVKVLATAGKASGSTTSARGSKSDSAPSATMTIAVPASQAIKIALAYNNGEGNIVAVLRSFSDESETDKTSIDTGELITGNISIEEEDIVIPDIDLPKPPSQSGYSSGSEMDLNSILNDVDGLPPPTPPTAQTRTHSIEIIQANSRQEVSFETEI